MRDILGERDSSVPDIPTRVSEPSRESQLPKRFYQSVDLVELDDGTYSIELDGKPVKTPGKSALAHQSRKIVEEIAGEWDAQGKHIDPMTMPVTRLANTAIDAVAQDMQSVREDIIRFSSSDLLCYRADGPAGLNEMHRQLWDPAIDWAHSALGARFELAEGVMFVEQPKEATSAFSVHVGQIEDPLLLSSCHVVTTLTGSAILAMAVVKGEYDLDTTWKIAHVDEDWNASQWGEDAEAMERRKTRFVDMTAAYNCIRALI